ncbi:hypothetical protein IMG5_029300, partial [Ichthyophthirius multifiliis]
ELFLEFFSIQLQQLMDIFLKVICLRFNYKYVQHNSLTSLNIHEYTKYNLSSKSNFTFIFFLLQLQNTALSFLLKYQVFKNVFLQKFHRQCSLQKINFIYLIDNFPTYFQYLQENSSNTILKQDVHPLYREM